MLRSNVGGAAKAHAVHQWRDKGIVCAHSDPYVNGGVLDGVNDRVRWQGEVLQTLYRHLAGVQNIEQKLGAVGLFKPPVQPPITEQRVGRNRRGNPGSRRLEQIDFDACVVDVPTVGFDVGVGEKGKSGLERLARKVGQVVSLEFKITVVRRTTATHHARTVDDASAEER